MKTVVALIGLLLMLTAATEASAKSKFKFFRSPAEIDDQYCQSLGAAPGTDAYIQCRLLKDQARQQALQNLGNFFLQQSQPRPFYNCTTNYFGFTSRTTCY